MHKHRLSLGKRARLDKEYLADERAVRTRGVGGKTGKNRPDGWNRTWRANGTYHNKRVRRSLRGGLTHV